MANLIFYDKVVSLDAHIHKELKLKSQTDFGFAAKTNSVPLVAIEFADVSREYPIAFVPAEDGNFLPVALLGLRQDENLFVSDDGQWEGRYIPAFVRRYPFVPADVGQGEAVICFDEAATNLGTDTGEPLFKDGKPAPLLQNVIKLMGDYQTEAIRTQEMCRRLNEYGLFIESSAQAQLPDGASHRLTGLLVVDEKRLQALAQDKVQALFASGELGLLYAHLISLGNLQRLVEKLRSRRD